MALLADDVYALQDLAGWIRRHGIHQVKAALKHSLREAEHAPDNVSLAEALEHALAVDADEPAGENLSDGDGFDGGSGESTDQQPLMPGPATTEPPAPSPDPEKPAVTTGATIITKRKRATYPKGHEKAGEFIPDDPSTPENEAFVQPDA
jgi:hypothetical protein